MPNKGAKKKGKKNNQLWTTLPAGARFQLDQLVALKVEGDSHSEIIREMVIAQLRTMRKEYNLKVATAGEIRAQEAEDEKERGS